MSPIGEMGAAWYDVESMLDGGEPKAVIDAGLVIGSRPSIDLPPPLADKATLASENDRPGGAEYCVGVEVRLCNTN